MTNDLIHFDTARRELMIARDVDEVKSIHDKAAALQVYARQQGESLEMQNAIAEIKIRAERRAGEILAGMERAPTSGLKQGPLSNDGQRGSEYALALEGAGISRQDGHRWQEIASIPEPRFESEIARVKGSGKELTTRTMLEIARNRTVTYENQPAIHATRGTVPLEGTAHVYTIERLLWPEEVEGVLESLLIPRSLHLCCGKSKLGDVRLDLHEEGVDVQADAANTGLDPESFNTVLCDPPYNGVFQWNHDLLVELARLARRRIIFQHWFIPANPDGYYKKDHRFRLIKMLVWQPRTYFGRAQIISVFDSEGE